MYYINISIDGYNGNWNKTWHLIGLEKVCLYNGKKCNWKTA